MTAKLSTDPARHLISKRRRSPHPLVTKTRELFKGQQPDHREGHIRPASGGLDMAVSRGSVSRALAIMDAAIKGAEARGHSVRIAGEKDQTIVTVDGTDVQIRLIEKTARSEHVPTAKEREPYSYAPKYDYRFTGTLVLSIEEWTPEKIRRSWRDTKRKKLEDQIDDFLDGVEANARTVAELQAERDREWEERRAKERRKLEEEERRREEERRIQELRDQAARWQEAKVLRKYIVEVEALAGAGRAEVTGGDVDAWAAWARDCADRLDPLGGESTSRSKASTGSVTPVAPMAEPREATVRSDDLPPQVRKRKRPTIIEEAIVDPQSAVEAAEESGLPLATTRALELLAGGAVRAWWAGGDDTHEGSE